ncbi:MAG: hypothetical protein Kow0080_18850 [Candidatus Promineifilaceae bacterium]
MKKNLPFIVLLLAAFVLAACGGGGVVVDPEAVATQAAGVVSEVRDAVDPTAVPTEEPTEEPTVEPTEVPTPEPTEEPTPTPEPTEVPVSTLMGQVVDSDSNLPLTGGQVCVQDTDQCANVDESGMYSLAELDPAEYVFEVTATDYVTATQTISLTAGETLNQDFALTAVEPTVEVAEGESPIWAEIKSNTLQDPVVLTGLVLDDASVTQQDGSALLSDGFEFYYGDVSYVDSHPLLAIQAGDRGTAIVLNTLTTTLDDVFAPIAKSSETTLGAAAVQALYTSSFAYKLVSIGGTNEPVMEGDLVEVTLGDENSSDPPYNLRIYRGEERRLIAEFQLAKK